MRKIGFVIPWYGEDIPGGAEMELREVATHLQRAGMDVEILTTCVREFSADWNENYYSAGTAWWRTLRCDGFRCGGGIPLHLTGSTAG